MVSEPLDSAKETLADVDGPDNIQGNRIEIARFLTP